MRWVCVAVATAWGAAGVGATEPSRWEFDRRLMATDFRIVMYESVRADSTTAGTKKTAQQYVRTAAETAFSRIDALGKAFNDYAPRSELNRVFGSLRPGEPTEVSADLAAILDRAVAIAAETDGAFDPTVGALTRRWRQTKRGRPTPTPDEIARLRERLGFEKIAVDVERSTVTASRADLALDLGGIAKGFAADAAVAVLREAGYPSCLVGGGGDLTLGDPPPGRDGWEIATETDGEPRTLTLANCGVATSGDRYRFQVIDGVRRSHVIDPRTGYGVTTPGSVTVIADDGATADAWASVESVRGTSGVVDLRTR